MSQKRLRLGILDTIFHYLMSIILVSVTVMMFYKLFTESYPPWLEWQRTNTICFGTIFLAAALFFTKRDYMKLEFFPIDLNGYDGKSAIEELSKFLECHNWITTSRQDDRLVASGHSLDDRFGYFTPEKQLTLVISEDQLLINCIITPPLSYRYTFGTTDRIVNDVISEFIKISNKDHSLIKE